MPWSLLIAPITKIIERLFPDKIQQEKAKAEMMALMLDAEAKEIESKSKVVVAEAQGESWMQRNWRPLTMLVFVFIIAFNFIFVPIMGMFQIIVPYLPIPPDMWTLLWIGIGGYITSRGAEKIATSKFNHKAYYESIRGSYGKLSQKDVDRMNKAIEEATK